MTRAAAGEREPMPSTNGQAAMIPERLCGPPTRTARSTITAELLACTVLYIHPTRLTMFPPRIIMPAFGQIELTRQLSCRVFRPFEDGVSLYEDLRLLCLIEPVGPCHFEFSKPGLFCMMNLVIDNAKRSN